MKDVQLLLVSVLGLLVSIVSMSNTRLTPVGVKNDPQVGTFLHRALIDQIPGSAGGVCFIEATSETWWKPVQDFLSVQNPIRLGNNTYRVVRLCRIEQCPTIQQIGEPKCGLFIVFLQSNIDKYMRQSSRLTYWTSSAVHVFLWNNKQVLSQKDIQLSSSLLSFGVTRALLLRVDPLTYSFEVRFPILFQKRNIVTSPEKALGLLSSYNQLANIHRYQYRTLYNTLIPYLYRYGGVFGGPDYRFLQVVLKHQNATHYWVYHRTTDRAMNSTDLNYVDQKLLGMGQVSFSFNRHLPWNANITEKLYLNTFDATCVMVPRKQIQTFILRLWEPFSQSLWYMVLALVLAAIFSNLTLPHLFTVNYILTVLFGSKIVNYRLNASDRAIVSVLDLLLFLLKEAYTAKIITYMIHMKYEPELETLEQLARVGPPLQLSNADYTIYNTSLRAVPGLRVAIRTDFSTFDTNWMTYFLPTFAHVVPCSYGRALVSTSNAMHGANVPKFYLLREKLGIQPEAFTFPRNQPFIARMRFYVRSLSETGIFESWLREDYYTQDRTPTLDEILRFANLASLFYVLLIGYVVGVMVFFGEWLVANLRGRFRKMDLRRSKPTIKVAFGKKSKTVMGKR